LAVIGVTSLLLAVAFVGSAAGAASPPGFKATFSGALKGKAKGGTSDAACTFVHGQLTNDDLALPGAIQASIGTVTTHWNDFTLKGGTQASLSLVVGAPVSGNPGDTEFDVPWASGAPRGSAELIVTTDSGEFVTTDSSKDLTVTTESKALINTTLQSGKKKLHVKATIDCKLAKSAAAGSGGGNPTSVGP
jgi:hypothetical protein